MNHLSQKNLNCCPCFRKENESPKISSDMLEQKTKQPGIIRECSFDPGGSNYKMDAIVFIHSASKCTEICQK